NSSVRNDAETFLSRHQTIVWFSSMVTPSCWRVGRAIASRPVDAVHEARQRGDDRVGLLDLGQMTGAGDDDELRARDAALEPLRGTHRRAREPVGVTPEQQDVAGRRRRTRLARED